MYFGYFCFKPAPRTSRDDQAQDCLESGSLNIIQLDVDVVAISEDPCGTRILGIGVS